MGETKPTTVAECLEHISDLYGEIEHSTRWMNDATEWEGDEDLAPRWQALYNKTHDLKERAATPDPRDARIAELERVLGALVDALPRCAECERLATYNTNGDENERPNVCRDHADETTPDGWAPDCPLAMCDAAENAERALGRRK